MLKIKLGTALNWIVKDSINCVILYKLVTTCAVNLYYINKYYDNNKLKIITNLYLQEPSYNDSVL